MGAGIEVGLLTARSTNQREIPSRSGLFLALAKQRDFESRRGIPQMADPQAGIDDLGKGQRTVEAARSLHRVERDRIGCLDVQPTLAYQVFGDDAVEPGEIDYVIDMSVHVVVHPARLDLLEMAKALRLFGPDGGVAESYMLVGGRRW